MDIVGDNAWGDVVVQSKTDHHAEPGVDLGSIMGALSFRRKGEDGIQNKERRKRESGISWSYDNNHAAVPACVPVYPTCRRLLCVHGSRRSMGRIDRKETATLRTNIGRTKGSAHPTGSTEGTKFDVEGSRRKLVGGVCCGESAVRRSARSVERKKDPYPAKAK